MGGIHNLECLVGDNVGVSDVCGEPGRRIDDCHVVGISCQFCIWPVQLDEGRDAGGSKRCRMKKTGLTLGKYAPFHKGHEYVLETMLKEMDEVIVVIYDTDVTTIPLQARAGWIQKIYPSVIVIEARGGPDGVPHDREYEIREEQFISGLLDGKKITAFYSSEYYGEHMSKALGCIDRRVDEAREVVPISARLIREDPYKFREYISDMVYQDLLLLTQSFPGNCQMACTEKKKEMHVE